MINCKLNVANRNSMYMQQIVAGFAKLQCQDKINFSFSERKDLKDEFFHDAIIEVIINNKRIIYDLTDGYNNFPSFRAFDEMLDNVDIYYKACVKYDFHKGTKNCEKIRILAPRYKVSTKWSPLNRVDYKSILKNRDVREIKKLLKKFSFMKNSEQNFYVERFEHAPIVSNEPKVFFYTRLWDPSIASGYSSSNVDLDGENIEDRIKTKSAEYAAVSELRSGLVRELKKEFGPRFVGGVAPDSFSTKYCPDLLGNVDMSSRRAYTKNLQSAEICVNTLGTHYCWNFSFGEELAASRAIITEEPFYEIPYKLSKGTNFYTYKSIDDCVQKVALLLADKIKLAEMMNANREYYLNHLRPDMYVWDTIKEFVE